MAGAAALTKVVRKNFPIALVLFGCSKLRMKKGRSKILLENQENQDFVDCKGDRI